MMKTTESIPISLVAHTAFCPRRAWLEAAGEKVASLNIEVGQDAHRTVDEGKSDSNLIRSMRVFNDALGVAGVCDVAELMDGGLELREFKSTPGRRAAEVTLANRVQLALQRLCLRSMGHAVVGQKIYFTNHRKSVAVDLTDEDEKQALALVEQTRCLVEAKEAPPPLEEQPHCRFCSHVSVCLPEERKGKIVTRIMPSDPDGEVLHLTVPGSRASLRGGRVLVQKGEEELASLPIDRVCAVVVHGNIDCSSALLRELMWRGQTIVWCSWRGKVVGFARPATSANGLARSRQHWQGLPQGLALARELVSSKIANQGTQLRRNGRGVSAEKVSILRSLALEVQRAQTVREILGLEGRAAAEYFAEFPCMLKESGAWVVDKWPGRVSRGATDALNVLLNYSYGLLLAECIRALLMCGLDPHIGVVHSSGRNKPALALDLMEQFRPVSADSVVLTLLNTGEIIESDLFWALGDARLRESARKSLVRAFERRLGQQIKHPVFGYTITWRRTIEVQARMVLGLLDGTQDRYVGVRTR